LVCAWLPESTLSPSKFLLGAAGGQGQGHKEAAAPPYSSSAAYA